MGNRIYNIWECHEKYRGGSTGNWGFIGKVRATSEKEALQIAGSRFGLSGVYKAYEGFSDL